MPISRIPIFNLNAVVKETGLQPDVLRAWERRYELPKPQRTPGGHRLYSEFDIAVVKWLRARQAKGLGISRAVELWKEISSAGRDPISEFLITPVLEERAFPVVNSQIDLLRNDWLRACLAFDISKAENVINQAFAMIPVEAVCFEILQKGISEIGWLWYLNKASVQQEHFATSVAIRHIETLITLTPNPTLEQTIIVGCPPGEWHSFPALLLTLVLRRKGLNVIYLGANVPLAQMEQTALAIHPALVILAAQQLNTASTLRSAALLFQRLHIPLGYGGLIFNRIRELRAQIPAYFLGDNLDSSISVVEKLIIDHAYFQSDIREEESGQETAAIFRVKLPLIEATLMRLLNEEGLTGDYILEVNSFVGTEISAALELGNLSFLEADFGWVKQLLLERKVAPDRLNLYLGAYQQAVSLEMGDDGAAITAWLGLYTDTN